MARGARDSPSSCSQDATQHVKPEAGQLLDLKGLNRWLWSLPMGASPCPPHPRQASPYRAVPHCLPWKAQRARTGRCGLATQAPVQLAG